MVLSINHFKVSANIASTLNSTYSNLSTSVQRLSSGLSVNSAADDPADFALGELQRADIAALMRGARNANDAVSLIQTAEGAVSIIDEKLIRMKELAEQASTGTYSPTQRLMIDSEFQQMASEIERIANATSFNSIKLLDGSHVGIHDGACTKDTGALKIHFGTGNDSAEDYFYLDISSLTLAGLGLREPVSRPVDYGDIPLISDKITPGQTLVNQASGIVSFAVVPAGTKDFFVEIFDHGANDTIQIFTRSGEHIAGTHITNWGINNVDPENFLTEKNGFHKNATYSSNRLNGTGNEITFTGENDLHNFNVHGMEIGYTGDGNAPGQNPRSEIEKLSIKNVTEDLVIIVAGNGVFNVTGDWSAMPDNMEVTEEVFTDDGPVISIGTQEKAQQAAISIENALAVKNSVRSRLGAAQTRLENTISHLNSQAENFQFADSRRSDLDIAAEMTEVSRLQIQANACVAMLAQANMLPQTALQMLGK